MEDVEFMKTYLPIGHSAQFPHCPS